MPEDGGGGEGGLFVIHERVTCGPQYSSSSVFAKSTASNLLLAFF